MPPVEPNPPERSSILADPRLALEVGRIAAESGQSALKALLFLNGGAAISFLTFVGQLLKDQRYSPETVQSFGLALRLFIVGTFVAVAASGVTYLSNIFQSQDWRRGGITLLIVAVLLGTVALSCFGVGGWVAADAFVATAGG